MKLFDRSAGAAEIGAGVDDDFRRLVRGRVERDQNLDSPGVAYDRHALVRRQLSADAEGQVAPPGELEERARQAVSFEVWAPIDRGHDTGRLRAENVSRCENGVTADVIERAAAGRTVSHIVGVEQAVGEERLDRPRFPNRPVPRKLP